MLEIRGKIMEENKTPWAENKQIKASCFCALIATGRGVSPKVPRLHQSSA